MRKTDYWGFELGLAEVLAIGLAAGLAVDFAIGLAAGFAVDLAIGLAGGFAAVAAFALAFGLGLALVAAIAVPVIKKPEATKAARSFFKRSPPFTKWQRNESAVGSSERGGDPLVGYFPLPTSPREMTSR